MERLAYHERCARSTSSGKSTVALTLRKRQSFEHACVDSGGLCPLFPVCIRILQSFQNLNYVFLPLLKIFFPILIYLSELSSVLDHYLFSPSARIY